jgi:hypothetical protein
MMNHTLPSPAPLRSASSPVKDGRGEESSLLPPAGEGGSRGTRETDEGKVKP